MEAGMPEAALLRKQERAARVRAARMRTERTARPFDVIDVIERDELQLELGEARILLGRRRIGARALLQCEELADERVRLGLRGKRRQRRPIAPASRKLRGQRLFPARKT